MKRRKGFTLVELMVVILIVSILAGVAIPLMQGRIDSAKWSEANAAAGTIRTAIRAYVAEKGLTQATTDIPDGTVVNTVLDELGFSATDLTGTYFAPTNYTVEDITANGIAVITVTAGSGLTGNYRLEADGDWVSYTP